MLRSAANYSLRAKQFSLALIVLAASGNSVFSADWLTAPSYYTHDKTTGQRTTQYAQIGPYYYYQRNDYIRSGYRHNRSTIQLAGSADNLHIVEEWGNPVRPYEEWRFPFKPYSVPYDAWGPPFGGLGGNGGYGGGYGPGFGGGFGPGFGGGNGPNFPNNNGGGGSGPRPSYGPQQQTDGYYPSYDQNGRSDYYNPYPSQRGQ